MSFAKLTTWFGPDFNFPPDDPAYSLLVGDPLLPAQKARLEASRVVHATIDPSITVDGASKADEEEEGAESGENDPDRIIVNARPAQPSDGLLTDGELAQLYRQSGVLVSTYDAGQRQVPGFSESGLTFGSRVSVSTDRRGSFEPIYTSYTHVSIHFIVSNCDRLLMQTCVFRSTGKQS